MRSGGRRSRPVGERTPAVRRSSAGRVTVEAISGPSGLARPVPAGVPAELDRRDSLDWEFRKTQDTLVPPRLAPSEVAQCDIGLPMSRSGDRTGTMGPGRAGSIAGVASGAWGSGPGERSAGAGRPVDADRGTGNPDRSAPRASDEASAGGRIEMTREVLADFKVIRRLLGPPRPVGDEGVSIRGKELSA
jgi:hypothetical protein